MRLTHGPQETERVGAEIARDLAPGDVVLISGDMGAGKTTLVRGALRELGIEGPVTSPTFTIGRRYDGGRIPASHLDLYRLGSLEDEDPTLLDDYVSEDRVAFVEWPAVAAATLPRVRMRVSIDHAGGDDRRIAIGP